jgi:hypothetical protein
VLLHGAMLLERMLEVNKVTAKLRFSVAKTGARSNPHS